MPSSLLELFSRVKPLCKTAVTIGSGSGSAMTMKPGGGNNPPPAAATINTSGDGGSAMTMANKLPGGGNNPSADFARMIHDSMPSPKDIQANTKNQLKDLKQTYRAGRGAMGRAAVSNVFSETLTGAQNAKNQAKPMAAAGSAESVMNRVKSVAPFAAKMRDARVARRGMKKNIKGEGTAALARQATNAAQLKSFF